MNERNEPTKKLKVLNACSSQENAEKVFLVKGELKPTNFAMLLTHIEGMAKSKPITSVELTSSDLELIQKSVISELERYRLPYRPNDIRTKKIKELENLLKKLSDLNVRRYDDCIKE